MQFEDDPRFVKAVAHFNAAEFEEATDGFEELFFEAVRDEVPFARVFLQISAGMHHVERNQLRASIERLEEGLRAVMEVDNPRGYDLCALDADVRTFIGRVAARMKGERERMVWPVIRRV
jgi:hypothetical protein